MKRVAALILVMLFCYGFMPRRSSTSIASPEPPSDSLAALYNYTDAIRLLMLSGDTTAGINALQRAVAEDSTYSPALYLLSSLHALTNIHEARDFAARAYRGDTANKWYAGQYGRLLVLDSEYDEALDIYLRLLRDYPNEPDNYRMVALLYQQQQKPFSSLVILDSAEVHFGMHPLLNTIKRNLLIGTRQYDKALTEADALIEAEPYNIDHHIALGDIYTAMGRDSLAEEAYLAALRIDSLDLQAQMALCDLHSKYRNYRKYLAAVGDIFRNDRLPVGNKVALFAKITSDRRFYADNFLQISELLFALTMRYPGNPEVIDLHAKHLIATGELDKALELYKSHLDRRPPVKLFYETVIDIERYKQRRDSTEKYMSRALQLFPNDISLYIRQGYIYGGMDLPDRARESFRKALPIATTDSVRSILWGCIGDMYQAEAVHIVNPDDEKYVPSLYKKIEENATAKKLLKRAFKSYDKALGLFYDNAGTLNNYAYFLTELGRDTERAVEMSRRATELSRNNATYLDTYAWALHKAGQSEQAKPIMQQAISLDDDNSAELFIHYGDILASLGEQFMAQIYWRRALENGYPAEEIQQRLTQPLNPDKQ